MAAEQLGQPAALVHQPGNPAGRAWLWSTVALTIGAMVAAVALAPPAGAAPSWALSWLLFTGSSAHVASTGWLFTVPEVRAYAREHKLRCQLAPASLIVLTAIAAAVISSSFFSWLLLPYFGWQFFHYQKQNVGMAALAAATNKVRPLQAAERWPLVLTGVSAILTLVARPGLLGLHLTSLTIGGQRWFGSWPRAVGHAIFPLAFATFTIAVVVGLAALIRRPPEQRPRGFCAVYLTSLLFSLPAFVFQSPYAAVGGMTIAHGLQYLLLVALVAAGGTGAQPRNRTRPARLMEFGLLTNVALIGGAALSRASHLHSAGPGWRLLFGAYLGIVMSHFVVDAGLWRMRDPLARQFVTQRLPYLVPRTAQARRGVSTLDCVAPISRQPT